MFIFDKYLNSNNVNFKIYLVETVLFLSCVSLSHPFPTDMRKMFANTMRRNWSVRTISTWNSLPACCNWKNERESSSSKYSFQPCVF